MHFPGTFVGLFFFFLFASFDPAGIYLENLGLLVFVFFVGFLFFYKGLACWPESIWKTDISVVCAVALMCSPL